MKLLAKEKCFGLNPRDFRSGNHIYLTGYHCEGLDFIVGCVGINNKAISVFRSNNPCGKIEYIDLYKTCIPELHTSLYTYEDPDLFMPSFCLDTVDEISIERNPTEYHYDFCLRDLLDAPIWLWQESCDIQKLKNGDKLVVHYFTPENELKIRTLEMGDFYPNPRIRKAIMHDQFHYVGQEVQIFKTDVAVTLDGCDFRLGNDVFLSIIGNLDFSGYQLPQICGLQLIPKVN